MPNEHASELEYLRWFRANTDFGPAHGDIIDLMNDEFVAKTGKLIPEEWKDGYYEGPSLGS